MVGTRTKWYRSLAVFYAWEQKAWADDREFTAEDIDETLWAIAGLALIWKGNIILGAVPGIAIVEAVVVTGAVAAFAIGGVEGVEDYVDFITTPSKYKERTEESLETIYEHVIKEPLVAAAEWYVGKVDQGIDYVNDTYDSATNWYQENVPKLFFTGPYLPF